MGDDAPRWLTYRHAADALGITPEAIAARARRRRWPKRTRNDSGEVEIAVPADQFPSSDTKPPRLAQDAPPTPEAPTPPTPSPDALAAIVGPLTGLLERERADRLTLQGQADALREDLHSARLEAAKATGEAALERLRREAAEKRAADLERQLAEARTRRRWWWLWRR